MNSNAELVNYLINTGVLKSQQIIESFQKIDRKDFVPSELLNEAYEDYPLSIGLGQTISQPYTVAFMLELLQPQFGDKILDVGFGSGYTTALLTEITGKNGKIYAMEFIPEIFEFGKKNIEKYNFISKGIVEVFLQSGAKGLHKFAPFDKILVSAAFMTNIPKALIKQLSYNGILVIPNNNGIWKITKAKRVYFPGFAFVPLIEK